MLRVPSSLPAAVTICQDTRRPDGTRRGGLGGGAVGGETSVSGDAGGVVGAGYLGIYLWLGFWGNYPKVPKTA